MSFEPVDALLAAYRTNQNITLYLIEHVPEEAWAAEPPGGKGRDIPAIVAHMHNVRGMWLKAAAKGVEGIAIPEKLERSCSKEDAAAALEASYESLHKVLERSLRGDGKIKGFKPDAAGFIGYLISHDAHHRGQISMLARQVGHPLPQKAMFGVWEWGSRSA